MPDNLFCQTLCQLPGIGRWMAEMLLIHCLERTAVMSYGDLAILRGLRMIYRHRNITKDLFCRYQKRYSPYGTVASIYIWAVSAGPFPGLPIRQKL
ncbi:hypothetical protein ACG98G_01035 [Megasphaera hexanoica]|nr:hypothetical protein [Megasphaera hexanoica]NME29402.1 hypothetical protein [Megasphaera hexanoica]